MNFTAGGVSSNAVVVAVGPSGRVCIVGSTTTDVVVDVLGWYGSTGARYLAQTARRVLDTRAAIGVPRTTPVAPGGTIALPLTGPPGTVAATLNVTATRSVASGFVTVYPCGAARPNASNLNPARGRVIASLTTVALGAGKVCLYTSTSTHLIADLQGWFTA